MALVLRYRQEKALKAAVDFGSKIRALRDAGELTEMPLIANSGPSDTNSGELLPREIKRSFVTLTEKVGAGQFGEVWKAVLDESRAGGVPGYMVAVKTSKVVTGDGADELCREAVIMSQLPTHPNVVALVGVVTTGPPLLLLLSFCENGSLQSFLKRRAGERQPLLDSERRGAAEGIALGMAHLTNYHVVHRDLAARNCLVDSQHACKVADFGLSRVTAVGESSDPEYYRSQKRCVRGALDRSRCDGEPRVQHGVGCAVVRCDGDRDLLRRRAAVL